MANTLDFPDVISGVTVDGLLVYPVAGSVSADTLQLAHDLVSGYSGDYVFFQYDDNEYLLVKSDSLTVTETGFSCDSCEWYDIHVIEHVQTAYRSNTGSLSGSIIGVEGGVAVEDFNGSFSGSYEVQEVRPSTYALYHDSSESYFGVNNRDHAVIYSSFDGTPSLVDGAEKYGFMVSVLMCGCIVFYFINSLFKRVR